MDGTDSKDTMDTPIRARLLELADRDYQAFASALIPTISNVMGVRLPELRKLAKEIARGDWTTYLDHAQDDWFEEVMLQGMVIGCLRTDVDEVLRRTASFVPKIDNWSVCDSFCSGLKLAAAHRPKVWDFLQPYLQSDREYDIRFAVVMLLNYYADAEYIEAALAQLDRIRHESYYVKMAVAWAISVFFVKLPEPTLAYLQNNSLDKETFNKALQKITESLRVDPETKQLIRGMKRK